MFDPKQIFPIVRKTMTKGTDEQVMGALDQLAKAHPDLNAEQALAALSMYVQKKQAAPSSLGGYLQDQGGTQ